MSATCERCGRLECEANGRHRFDYMIIDCLEEQVARMEQERDEARVGVGLTAQLSAELEDASIEKACDMANDLAESICGVMNNGLESLEWQWEEAKNLHYMLEYLRLNFDLVPKGRK